MRTNTGRAVRRAGLGALLAAAIALVSAPQAARANGIPFASGDVFAAIGNGQILHVNGAGAGQDTLSTSLSSPLMSGMCFDSFGNLRSTNFSAQSVSEFDRFGTLIASPWATLTTAATSSPESCVVDNAGTVYVSAADGGFLDRFDASGALLQTYYPATEGRGIDWVDLAADNCTIYYTSEGNNVKTFNVCANVQGPDFAANLAGPCYTVRIMPSNGHVLVACQDQVYELDSAGAQVAAYTTSGLGAAPNSFFALALDSDGHSFWVGDQGSGNVYKVDTTSQTGGYVFTATPAPGSCLCGLAVYGATTASGGTNPPTAGESPPIAVANNSAGTYAGTEGLPIALNHAAAYNPDGDPLTSISWSYAAGSGVDAHASCTLLHASGLNAATLNGATITCTDEGSYTVTLTVADGDGLAVTSTAAVTVSDATPVPIVVSPAQDQLFAAGSTTHLASVPVSATFTDTGSLDTHTCALQWVSDAPSSGSGTAAVTAEPSASSPGTCSGTLSLPPGVYCVTVSVVDADGNNPPTGTSCRVQFIVYDPAGGFVTGGGWINSGAGSVPANPSLTGKANFGFVSKYQKGATIPTGQTQFDFQVGGFSFHSDAYQWLVISGSMAQYKGTGTAITNGVSQPATFLLTARDGDMNGGTAPDGFRMKITSSSGGVIYDNMYGAPDDCTAANTQTLGGGDVMVHKG